MCECVFFTLTDPASIILYPVVYAVTNSVCGLLHRKRSQEHLQSSNEGMKYTIEPNQSKLSLFVWVF